MTERDIPSFSEEYHQSILEDVIDMPETDPQKIGQTAYDIVLKGYIDKGLIREL